MTDYDHIVDSYADIGNSGDIIPMLRYHSQYINILN